MQAGPTEETVATYNDLVPKDLQTGRGLRGQSPALRQAQMRDYARSARDRIGQRIVIFAVALIMASYYYPLWIAIATVVLIAISETFDAWAHRVVLSHTATDPRTVRRNFALLFVSTVFSTSTVVFFALSIALSETSTSHFMPLFFLLAGSIFAAMNDNQVLTLLKTRILLYGTAFLAIPILDILRKQPPLHSPEWSEFFTSLFVIGFIVEVSRVFLNVYRRQLQQMVELRDQVEKAKVASKAKSEFLSVMSHELRTPMTSINGAVGLAASGTAGPLTPTLENILGIAQSNCRRLSELINDILDLQKIEAGKMEFRSEPVELNAFLKKSCELNGPYANSLKITFETASEAPDTNVIVEADERRLDRVMSNLLSNAAKFSAPGDVVTAKLSVAGSMARIEVIDRGVGLSEDMRDLVFDAFTQIDSSGNRRVGGTGLGMNISKQIMDAHGGRIDYRKNAGPGTTFFIDLPLKAS